MPLTVNVGLSRKASKDYQSTGKSINLTAELDATLLAKPEELQREIDEIYEQAGQALDRQTVARPAGSGTNGRTPPPVRKPAAANGNGRTTGSKVAVMTVSQRRAITSITERLGLDAEAEARHSFGWNLEDLSIREAGDFIDHLRSLQTSENGRPR